MKARKRQSRDPPEGKAVVSLRTPEADLRAPQQLREVRKVSVRAGSSPSLRLSPATVLPRIQRTRCF